MATHYGPRPPELPRGASPRRGPVVKVGEPRISRGKGEKTDFVPTPFQSVKNSGVLASTHQTQRRRPLRKLGVLAPGPQALRRSLPFRGPRARPHLGGNFFLPSFRRETIPSRAWQGTPTQSRRTPKARLFKDRPAGPGLNRIVKDQAPNVGHVSNVPTIPRDVANMPHAMRARRARAALDDSVGILASNARPNGLQDKKVGQRTRGFLV